MGATASNLKVEDPIVEDKKAAVGMPDRTWVIVEESDEIPPSGLFLQHNGRPFMVKPGEPVHMPNYLLKMIDDAITSAPITDAITKQVIGSRDRRRYNYRIVDAPADVS